MLKKLGKFSPRSRPTRLFRARMALHFLVWLWDLKGVSFPPQGPGTTDTGPAPLQTTCNSNPIPSYSLSTRGPAEYYPVNTPTQQYPAVPDRDPITNR